MSRFRFTIIFFSFLVLFHALVALFALLASLEFNLFRIPVKQMRTKFRAIIYLFDIVCFIIFLFSSHFDYHWLVGASAKTFGNGCRVPFSCESLEKICKSRRLWISAWYRICCLRITWILFIGLCNMDLHRGGSWVVRAGSPWFMTHISHHSNINISWRSLAGSLLRWMAFAMIGVAFINGISDEREMRTLFFCCIAFSAL